MSTQEPLQIGDERGAEQNVKGGAPVSAVVVVAVVAAISAAILGLVYAQARPRIVESRRQEKISAFEYILPSFDNSPLDTGRAAPLQGEGMAQPATVFTATNSSNDVVGMATQSFTTESFGPRIDLLVGANSQKEISGIYILNHQETPGLGAKATIGQSRWQHRDEVPGKPFLFQFAGKGLHNYRFNVRKDGGDVDAITASTITSRAIAQAVERALHTIAAQPSKIAPSADEMPAATEVTP